MDKQKSGHNPHDIGVNIKNAKEVKFEIVPDTDNEYYELALFNGEFKK